MADNQYASQLNQMLQPYQETVRTFNRPYQMLGNGLPSPSIPDGMNNMIGHIPFLGSRLQGVGEGIQDHWGQINRGLDNALLAGAMTPEARGPEGAGGGITRALQGVLGAGQYRRQVAMQSAMMPYQMLEPRVKMEDELAQMDQRKEQSLYDKQRSQWYDARTDAMNNPKAIGQQHVADDGSAWQEVMDPSNPKAPVRLYNPVTSKFADQLPSDLQPGFENQKKSARVAASGGYLGDLTKRLSDADPAVKAAAEKELTNYNRIQQGASYNKGLGGQQGHDEGPHTYEDTKTLITSEKQNMYVGGLESKNRPEDKMMEEMAGMSNGKDLPMVQNYRAKQKQFDDARAQREQKFAEWSQSDAPKRGIGFQKWLTNPNSASPSPSDAPAQQSAPSAPASTSGNGGGWRPS